MTSIATRAALFLCFVAVLLGGAVMARVDAATLIVTTTNDGGPGSLRQALADAHDGDTIQFDPALNGQTITLTSAELVIDKSVTVSGPGPGLLRVSGNHQSTNFRILHITPGHTAGINGLTISGGQVEDFAGGGGIYNNGTLSLINSTVSGNSTVVPSSGGGGGISNAGTLTITQSSISGNSGYVSGGGIYNSGMLTISDSTVSSNQIAGLGHNSGNGGGIANSGTLIIQNSTVSGNSGNGDGGSQGGGISNSGSLDVTNSTISDNTAIRGGGIYGWGRVTNSTISGNSTSFDGGGLSGTGIVSNSTISGNSANHSGGGIYGGGTITNSTISGNTANSNQGGGIYVTNQIVLGNTILKTGTSGANIFNNGTVISHGYNLSSDNGGGLLTAPGDQINIDPMLGPLQYNGGPTFTHDLLTGSPAIDAGDPSFTPPPLYDQRGPGWDRVFNSRIDIGSLEVQPVTPTPGPTATATAAATPSTAQLADISTRLHVETGDNVMIGGFILTGAGSLRVAIRGIGPSLGQQGISDFLPDPILELRDSSGSLLVRNDNWQDDPTQAAQLLQLGLAPGNQAESALVRSLQPGAYTAIIAGKNGGIGVGLVEVYNVENSVPVANLQLANISTRGFVQTGNNVMIGGFILGTGTNTNIMIRGLGPSLSSFGIPNPLADPTLELRDSNGALLASNDNCAVSPLPPPNPLESCIGISLPPAAYTAILAGKDGGTGIGLIEIYNLQ